jgi:hypothetical protein
MFFMTERAAMVLIWPPLFLIFAILNFRSIHDRDRSASPRLTAG